MIGPKRIQRRRTKGWSAPKTAVYVGRPSRWSNLHKVGSLHPDHGHPMSRAEVVAVHAAALAMASPETLAQLRAELGGRDLMCWCRLDQPCHADTLLQLANPKGTP